MTSRCGTTGRSREAGAPLVAGYICFGAWAGKLHPFIMSEALPKGQVLGSASVVS